jgi:hypothetical protein
MSQEAVIHFPDCHEATRHRRSATQSIRRRLGRSAGRTNINLTPPRASRCSTGPGGLYDAEPQARSNGAHSSWRSLKLAETYEPRGEVS